MDFLKLLPINSFRAKRPFGSNLDWDYKWGGGIDYQDTQGKRHEVNIFECVESVLGTAHHLQVHHKHNSPQAECPAAVSHGTFKVEEGKQQFQRPEDQGYELKHLYSKHSKDWRVFNIVLQIATITELLLTYSKLVNPKLRKTAKAVRNLASKILEAIRKH